MAAAVLEMVHRDIARRQRSYRLSDDDVEDVRQDVMVDLLRQQQKRGRPFTLEDGGLIRVATRSRMSKGLDQSAQNGKDRKAYTLLQQELDSMKAAGAVITGSVRREAAERIRLSFPAGNRPHEDFYDSPSMTSLETPIGDSGDTLGDILAPSDVVNAGVASDDSAASRLMSARLHGEIDQRTAKAGAWDAVADGRDAPRAACDSVPHTEVSTLRKRVAEDGGVLAAARAWELGDLDDAGEHALFKPFGSLSNSEMESVTSTLTSFPEYANELWESALTSASTRSLAFA
ncbi:hypothetical protein [Microbacterium enclense]|uniref:hypothetical protein n=1 Tax=Microbacterium enclense TaxID=993073 RepID=UPI003F7E36F4